MCLPNRNPRRRAFSLVEVLVVIAIIVLIASFSSSALRGLAEGSHQQRAVIGISAILEGTRQSAIANGTYTWVGMNSEKDPDSQRNVVTVASFASKDGTRGPSVKNNDKMRLLSKVETYESVVLDDDPASLAEFGKQLPDLDPGNSGVSPESPQSASFKPSSDDLSKDHDKKTFDWVILFTPRGEASIETTGNGAVASGSADATGDNLDFVRAIEFGIVSSKGDSPSSTEEKSAAAIRVNGLTGQVDVYQPQAGS